MTRFGSSVSVLDYLQLGSTLSLRSYYALGSTVPGALSGTGLCKVALWG